MTLPSDDRPKIDFLGVGIDPLSEREAAAVIAARPAGAPFAYVVTPNAQHLVSLSRGEGVWRDVYQAAWMRLCDGRIVQPLARLLLGLKLPYASGSDLTLRLVRDHIGPDDAVTVIGGGSQLEAELRRQFGWTALSVFDPPFGLMGNVAAQDECLAYLRLHPARYVFFTVGSPQSEWLALRAKQAGGLTGTGLCVGSSLLFATGLVRRAPLLMQKLGLEALYRLTQRPRSHLRRIFVESLPVVLLLLRARFGKARILPHEGSP
jgi:N-acetylglucosaminyldiphosphoundecaprenol N-acetyl-beta-D-mannosaminyltransferase